MSFMLFKFKYKTGVCHSCYSSLNIKLGYVIHGVCHSYSSLNIKLGYVIHVIQV